MLKVTRIIIQNIICFRTNIMINLCYLTICLIIYLTILFENLWQLSQQNQETIRQLKASYRNNSPKN